MEPRLASMKGLLAVGAVVGALVAVAVSTPSGAGAPADRLVPVQEELAGLKRTGGPKAAARRSLRNLRAGPVSGIDAARFTAGRGPDRVRLDVSAGRFKDTAASRRALRRWRLTTRKNFKTKTAPLKGLGTQALIGLRRRGRIIDVRVALREGPILAQLRYRTRTGPKDARQVASQYARVEAERLERALKRTAWDRVQDGIRPDGTASVRTALQAASLRYGAIPGVGLPKGARGAPNESGTVALARAVAAARTLPMGKQRQLATVLAGQPSRRAEAPRRAALAQAGECPGFLASPPVDRGRAGVSLIRPLSSLATDLRDEIARRIGLDPPSWAVCVYPFPEFSRDADPPIADSYPWSTSDPVSPFGLDTSRGPRWEPEGPIDMCLIRASTEARSPGRNQPFVFAHEAFHCLAFEMRGRGPGIMWSGEGLADWAAHRVAPAEYQPTSRVPGSHLSTYLAGSGGKRLFQMGYDAWGFFGRVEEVIGSPALFSRISAVWAAEARGSEAIYGAVVGASEERVLAEWGSGLARRPEYGPAWAQALPITVPLAWPPGPTIAPLPLGGRTRIDTSAQPVQSRLGKLSGIEDRLLVELTIDGPGRVTDGSIDVERPVNEWFCFRGPCQCESDETQIAPIPEHGGVAGNELLAGYAAGPGRPTRLTAGGHSISEFCEPEEDPPPDFSRGGGSVGDPHLLTFDGNRYSFQAVGEFILAKGPGLEIQARQSQWKNSQFVSVNTQFGMRIGPNRVRFFPGGQPRVDRGAGPRPVRGPIELPGGGSIARAGREDDCRGLIVTWPNGSAACVWAIGPRGLNIRVSPAPEIEGKLVGLLGNADGLERNDFKTRAGRALSRDLVMGDSRPAFRARYRALGNSWRIRQGESLLRYGRGQNTATFTDRTLPRQFFDIENLPPAPRRRAEATCRARGVTDPDLLEDCIVDVAVTGIPAFASSMAREQRLSVPPPLAIGEGARPWVAVDGEGTTHVVWRKPGPTGDELHYRRRPAGASEFEADRTLPIDSGAAQQDLNGPAILHDPERNRLVLITSRCCIGGAVYALVSSDGGTTWSAGAAVYDGLLGNGSISPGGGRAGTVATSPGSLFIMTGGGRVAELPVGLNTLQETSSAQRVAGVLGGEVAAGPTGPVFSWTEGGNGFVRSGTSGGVVPIGAAATTDIAAGSKGALVLTTATDGERRLEARRLEGGAPGRPVRVSSPDDGDPVFPYVSTSPDGAFHAVWATEDRNLATSSSTDGGATWSGPRTVATKAATGEVFEPAIAVGEDGTGSVVWHDNMAPGSVSAVGFRAPTG